MYTPVPGISSPSSVMNPISTKSFGTGTKADCATIQNSYGIHNPRIDTRTDEQHNLYNAIIVQLSQADKDFITPYYQEMLPSLAEKLTEKLVCREPFKLILV